MPCTNFGFCSGKTSVARLFAKILKDTEMRKSSNFLQETAEALKSKGVDEFRKIVKKAEDGVLFIDEAYELDPNADKTGKSIALELMTFAEDNRDKHTFIIAGYQKDMNEKFYSFNDGLKSRFEEVIFDDFSPWELRKVWEGILEKSGWRCDREVTDVVVRRLNKKREGVGFGNAREVRKVFEAAKKAAMTRKDFEESNMELIIQDIIGPRPSLLNGKLKEIMDEVNQ